MLTSLGPTTPPAPVAPVRSEAPAPTTAGAAAAPQVSRLIIDRDRQSGAYAFTVVDAKTGEVMSRVPFRVASDMAAATDYRPGSIARLSV